MATGATTVTLGQEEHVFYELSNTKPGQHKRKPRPPPIEGAALDDDFDEDDDDDYQRKPRTAAQQEAADLAKR